MPDVSATPHAIGVPAGDGSLKRKLHVRWNGSPPPPAKARLSIVRGSETMNDPNFPAKPISALQPPRP